jgi:hypothetical protein
MIRVHARQFRVLVSFKRNIAKYIAKWKQLRIQEGILEIQVSLILRYSLVYYNIILFHMIVFYVWYISNTMSLNVVILKVIHHSIILFIL